MGTEVNLISNPIYASRPFYMPRGSATTRPSRCIERFDSDIGIPLHVQFRLPRQSC
jgi:hypothetical protein